MPGPYKIETTAVHAGRQVDPATGAVTPPIHLSTTFERGADGEYPRGFSYSGMTTPIAARWNSVWPRSRAARRRWPSRRAWRWSPRWFKGSSRAIIFLAPDDVYYAVRRVIGEVFAKSGLEATYVDMTDLDAVRAAVRPSTRLVWVETPSNPLMKITDLAEVAALARAANAISVCDGTFASPILQRPLEQGIDMVTHSTTKYVGGHSDVVGGALITGVDNYLFERARKSQQLGGAVPSPFDCWLTLRGVNTLPYRMRAHSENATRVAGFLESHAAVEAVHYPDLSSHPGHPIAARQMSGFGGMLSAQVRGGREKAMDVAARVRLFTRATSLGGPHSFIEHRASIEGRNSKTPQSLLRLSIGLENPGDLIADLEQALHATVPRPTSSPSPS